MTVECFNFRYHEYWYSENTWGNELKKPKLVPGVNVHYKFVYSECEKCLRALNRTWECFTRLEQ